MSDLVVHATDQTFDNDINTETLVLIDFWAEWCGPCRALGPVVDELATEYEGKLKVLKVNVDENQSLAMRYQVMSIPTIVLLRGGQEVEKIIGAFPKNTIQEKINSALS